MNPLMNMMNSAMGNMGGTGGGSMMGMFQNIRRFAGLIGSRNPQQMVRNYMRMNNIPENQLGEVMNQAQEIARMMNIR